MILSDGTIQQYLRDGTIKFIAGDERSLDDLIDHVVCASFDLRLGNEFKIFPVRPDAILNPFVDDSTDITEHVHVADGEDFVLHPGRFILGATKERIGLPDHLVARVE